MQHPLPKDASMSGFSLMDLVISLGLTGILALGVSSILRYTSNANVDLEGRQEARALLDAVVGRLKGDLRYKTTSMATIGTTSIVVTRLGPAGNTYQVRYRTVCQPPKSGYSDYTRLTCGGAAICASGTVPVVTRDIVGGSDSWTYPPSGAHRVDAVALCFEGVWGGTNLTALAAGYDKGRKNVFMDDRSVRFPYSEYTNSKVAILPQP